jgi:ribosomal protein S20
VVSSLQWFETVAPHTSDASALQTQARATQQTVAMFVSRQVIEKLEGEQSELRREVKYLRRAVERGDNTAVKVHAEDLASRIENHASLVDAVLEAVSEDTE